MRRKAQTQGLRLTRRPGNDYRVATTNAPGKPQQLSLRTSALMVWQSVLQNVSFLLTARLKPQVLEDADCHVAAFWATPRNDILVSILFDTLDSPIPGWDGAAVIGGYWMRMITRCAETGRVPPARGVMVRVAAVPSGLRTVRTELTAVVSTMAMPTIWDTPVARPATV